jgi:hypothetical protein
MLISEDCEEIGTVVLEGSFIGIEGYLVTNALLGVLKI